MPDKAEKPDFLFVAGQAALDFLNTRPIVQGHVRERIGSLEDLVRWLVRAGRMDARGAGEALKRWGESPEGPRIAERARGFRETLRQLTDGIVRGRGISSEAVAAINFILAENDGNLRLERPSTGGHRMRFVANPTRPVSLLGNLAEAAAELLASRDLRLIRRCGNPECVLYFYDGTRNHRRQWCAMRTCGNRMKVRAFRKRQRRGD